MIPKAITQVCEEPWSLEEVENLPTVTIYLNFHFEANPNTGANFPDDPSASNGSGQWFASQLIQGFNNRMQNVEQNLFNGPNGVPANPIPNGDAHLRVAFYNNSMEESIFFYGQNENATSINGDAVLDVVIRDEPETNDPCPNRGGYNNTSPSTFMVLRNFHCAGFGPTDGINQHIFAHELIHSLGLCHSHHCDQKAFDIDPDVECNPSNPALGCVFSCGQGANNCSGESGNNIMGDNQSGYALTPGQVQLIFNHFSTSDYTNYEYNNGCDKTAPPLYVSSSDPEEPIVWTGLRYYWRDVIVQTGTTLIIECGVRMAHKAKIRVERGARLVVLGATISSICKDKEWGGIEVAGNSTIPHEDWMAKTLDVLDPNDPGVVHLDEAILENASTAISTKKCCIPYAQQITHRGGLIVADKTHFINNRRAVEFLKFQKTNKSSFNECVFQSDRGNRAVTIWDCNKILFEKCTFYDLGNKDKEGNDVPDVGITLLDGGMVVHNNTDFTDLDIGIDCYNTTASIPDKIVMIGHEAGAANDDGAFQNNGFINNKVHIQANSIDELYILRNNFGEVTVSPQTGAIQLSENTGYFVDDNDFDHANLKVSFNGTLSNRIYNNTFMHDSGSAGSIHVKGSNIKTIFDRNCFTDSGFDVRLNGSSLYNSSLDPFFGSFSAPVYNSFSYDVASHSPHEDFRVPSFAPEITYYYDPLAETENPSLIPRCGLNNANMFCDFWIQNFNAFESDEVLTDGLDACLSVTLLEKDEPECISFECLENLRDSILFKQEIFDGGDSEGLLSAIEFAPQAVTTVQSLLDASPYLTDMVMEAVMLNANFFDSDEATILMANAPLSHSMMALAAEYVDANTYADLEAEKANNPYSDRLFLENDIDIFQNEYQLTLKERLKILAQNEDYAGIEQTLLFDGTDFSMRRIFGMYLRQNDFVNAQMALDNLPLVTEEDQIFYDIQTINLAFLSATDSFELSPTQDSLLYDLAYQDKRGTNFARALLVLLKDEVFIMEEEEEATENSASSQKKGVVAKKPQLEKLLLKPNPANDAFAVTVSANLPLSEDSKLQVFNNVGNLVWSKNIDSQSRHIKINTQSLTNGLYFVGLWNNGKLKAFETLVISK